MNYPLADGSGFLEIATTRPEALLGDTAVAVRRRRKHVISAYRKAVILPLVNEIQSSLTNTLSKISEQGL